MTLMAGKVKFDAIILQHEDMNAAYVDFPFSTEELFGKKGQVKIKALLMMPLNIVEALPK